MAYMISMRLSGRDGRPRGLDCRYNASFEANQPEFQVKRPLCTPLRNGSDAYIRPPLLNCLSPDQVDTVSRSLSTSRTWPKCGSKSRGAGTHAAASSRSHLVYSCSIANPVFTSPWLSPLPPACNNPHAIPNLTAQYQYDRPTFLIDKQTWEAIQDVLVY